MTRLTKALAAVAIAGAMAIGVGVTVPASAQVYFEGPGIEFGVGPRYRHYYDYGPYRYHHRYYRDRYWDGY